VKQALDQFFLLIGEEACRKIEVVASDQHESYAASIREHASSATHVWDRFHVMQIFESAVNETRKSLDEEQEPGSELKRLSRGAYRFLFVKKAKRRTAEEKTHIDEVLRNLEYFRLKYSRFAATSTPGISPFQHSCQIKHMHFYEGEPGMRSRSDQLSYFPDVSG
jgi:transposase